MKFIVCAAFSLLLLVLAGCRHTYPGSTNGAPNSTTVVVRSHRNHSHHDRRHHDGGHHDGGHHDGGHHDGGHHDHHGGSGGHHDHHGHDKGGVVPPRSTLFCYSDPRRGGRCRDI